MDPPQRTPDGVRPNSMVLVPFQSDRGNGPIESSDNELQTHELVGWKTRVHLGSNRATRKRHGINGFDDKGMGPSSEMRRRTPDGMKRTAFISHINNPKETRI